MKLYSTLTNILALLFALPLVFPLPGPICVTNFYFNDTLSECSRCSTRCPDEAPVQLCSCTVCSDLVCSSTCPPGKYFSQHLSRCLSDELERTNCTQAEAESCQNGVCHQNVTSTNGSALCVCNQQGAGCDLVVDHIQMEWCSPVWTDDASVSPPALTFKTVRLDVVDSLDGALIGFIVAIACIGVVVVSTVVILLVGISLHNRFVVWGQVRQLRRLRREREQRERRQEAARRARTPSTNTQERNDNGPVENARESVADDGDGAGQEEERRTQES
eukprot:m.4195 g.4195  ORF g.4195 m.4195 type:complete len:275 (+) comp10376_c0_seq1:103-927(+)